MKTNIASIVLPHLDKLLADYEVFDGKHKYNDWSDITVVEAQEFLTAGLAAIHRTVGPDSSFSLQAKTAIKEHPSQFVSAAIPHMAGILRALHSAISNLTMAHL